MRPLILLLLLLAGLVSESVLAQPKPWKRPLVKNCTVISSTGDSFPLEKLPVWSRELTKRVLIVIDPRTSVEGWAQPGNCIDIVATDGTKLELIMQKVILAHYPKLKCQTIEGAILAAEILVRPSDLKKYLEFEADEKYLFSLVLRSSCETESTVQNSSKKRSACYTLDSKKKCIDD